ncbi:MAG TPA: tetratricopeptide repeat protein [Acidobacteriota bacterium]|nr:tetratricopeptide repeat protein [Acidobacteriota bacterium]
MRNILILLILISAAGCSSNKVKPSPKVPEGNPVVELKQGNELLAQKHCAEASKAYGDFLAKYPKDAGGWNLLGLAQLCDGKPELAVVSMKKALEIAPTFTDVHNNLGVTYMEMKSYPDARAEFLKALEDKQYSASGPYFNLSRLAFVQGNFEESRALAKKVMEFSPKEIGPRILYAASLMQLDRLDEALVSIRETSSLAPENAEVAFYMGSILAKKNQPCEARKYLNKVLDDDPLGQLGQQALAMLKTLPKCNP